jgi:predicted transcriptional regulator
MTTRLDDGLYERLRRVAFELRVPMASIITEGTAARVAELEAQIAAGA